MQYLTMKDSSESVSTKEYVAGVIPIFVVDGVYHTLVIEHKAGRWWGFPKGHIEKGEQPFEAAKRELFEETGLKVSERVSEAPIRESYQFAKNGKHIEKEVLYFICSVTSQNHKVCEEEISGAHWVPIEKAPELITYGESKRVCQKAERILKKRKYPKLSFGDAI